MRPTFKRGRVTEQRHFTQDELERFFRACPPDSKTLYALMLVTGAREAELVQSTRSSHVALLKSEVDLDRRFVTIRTAKTKPGSKSETRILPIPEELVEPLQRRIASVKGPHLFQARWDSCKKFNVILRRAGIPKKDELGRKVTSHSFRHTYATLMAEAVGNNQFLLMKLLGHKQVSTTERYCHPTAPIVRLNLDLNLVESCKIVDVEVSKSAWVV
jgi:integrase